MDREPQFQSIDERFLGLEKNQREALIGLYFATRGPVKALAESQIGDSIMAHMPKLVEVLLIEKSEQSGQAFYNLAEETEEFLRDSNDGLRTVEDF